MYCSKCGEPVHEQDRNCSQCGQPTSPGGPGPLGTPAPTYLVPSILVTLFCCQILGIVAIVFSAIAMGKNSSGDFAGAQQAAKTAKTFNWIGFGIGFAGILIYAAIMIIGGIAASTP